MSRNNKLHKFNQFIWYNSRFFKHCIKKLIKLASYATIDKKSNLPRILFRILSDKMPEIIEIKQEVVIIASSINSKIF